MGAFHVKQRGNETTALDKDEISFLAYGGQNFAKKVMSNEAFFVTLRHDTKIAYIACVPNA